MYTHEEKHMVTFNNDNINSISSSGKDRNYKR